MKQRHVPLTKDIIDGIFEKATSQDEYTLDLWRHALPAYDRATAIVGYPRVSEETGSYLFEKAMEFDRLHHPKAFPGGLWLNYGFSSTSTVPPWVIALDGVKLALDDEKLAPRETERCSTPSTLTA